MPHCWPQKQQWVSTIRSGSTSAFQPVAGIRFRVGPNWATNSGISTGGLAINSLELLRDVLSAYPAHATSRPVQSPATYAGTPGTHPGSDRRLEADNGCPAPAERP